MRTDIIFKPTQHDVGDRFVLNIDGATFLCEWERFLTTCEYQPNETHWGFARRCDGTAGNYLLWVEPYREDKSSTAFGRKAKRGKLYWELRESGEGAILFKMPDGKAVLYK